MGPRPGYTEAEASARCLGSESTVPLYGQTYLEASLLEKEEGNTLGACFLLSFLVSTFHQLTGLWKSPLETERDALTEAGPYQKSREGKGREGVLAAPRAEFLNPGHKLSSKLI